jgi:hypothetical protein
MGDAAQRAVEGVRDVNRSRWALDQDVTAYPLAGEPREVSKPLAEMH